MIAEQEQGTATTEAGRPVVPHPNARRFVKARRQNIPGPRWAMAFEEYVSGRLASWEQVGRYLGVCNSAVARRAIKEGWTQAREARTRAIIEQVKDKPGLELRRGKEDLEELEQAQAALAKLLMSQAKSMSDLSVKVTADVALLSAKLVDMQASDTAIEPSIRRISALSSLSESLLGQVRILAGLPNPDKVPRSIAQQPEPVRPSSASRPAMPESLPDNGS